MSSRLFRPILLILAVSLATPGSAQVTIDYGGRSSPSAQPIPPGIISAQLGFLQSTGGLTLLRNAGFRQMRLDAQLSNVFLTNDTPDWTVIDPVLQLLQNQHLEPMIVVDYTPGWLQQTPNPCPPGIASYHASPRDVGRWAALAAQFVHHMNTAFPGLVTDYEIWNEPDIPNGLCAPDDTTRLNTYLSMYAAAAGAMRAQAANDGKPIHIGGPAVVNNPNTWIPSLLSNRDTSGLVDFVSYHKYLGYTALIQNGLTWDGANGTSALRDLIHNFGDSYRQIAGYVRAGSQPNPSGTPIYITEYNDDAAFMQDCCRNSPTYSPLFNVMTVASLMNTVYAGAQSVPSRLHYFSASTSSGFFCLVGVIDAAMDCSTTGGPLNPYPQYYAYQLLAGSNFLNLAAGGNMAVSQSITSPLTGFAFYTSEADALVLVNPTSTDATGVSLRLQNPGTASTNAVVYLLNAANQPMSSSTLPMTASGNSLSGNVDVPALSIVALSLPASSSGIVVSISPTSAAVTTGHTQQFAASATGGNPAVMWSVDGVPGGSASVGTVTADGLYTAPGTAGTHTVTASSVADPTATASAVVTVQSAVVVSISPATATLTPGQQQSFTATVSNAANTQVAWSVDDIPNGNPTVGTISSSGMYVAPSAAGDHVITATSLQDANASASAQVSVAAAADFTISPQNSTSATVVAGESATFIIGATSLSGFSGNIQFSCAGAPPQGSCSPSPAAANLAGGGTVSVAYVVSTAPRTASASMVPFAGSGLGALITSLSLFLIAKFRRVRTRWWTVAALFSIVLLFSCGGGGGSGSTPPPGTTGTPAGTYNLTLTATSGAVTHNTPVKLTVQ